MGVVLELLVEPWTFEFMQRALVVTVVASVVCAIMSCWLVLIGWALMGDAVSHAVLPGVVLSYALGLPFAIGAFVFGCGAVALIGFVRATSRVKGDAAIGVVFTTLFALGLVLTSVTPSQIDLQHILFGNVLGVRDSEILQVVVIGVLASLVLIAKRRDLTLYAFDPRRAHSLGISPQRLSALLLGVLALTVVVALQAVGVVLAVAMLITPGATAQLLTERMSRMLVIAPAAATVAAVGGLYASYYLDTSSGGTVVLLQGLLFCAAYVLSPARGLARRRTRGSRLAEVAARSVERTP